MGLEALVCGYYKQLVLLLLILIFISQAYYLLLLHWQQNESILEKSDKSSQTVLNTFLMDLTHQVEDAHIIDSSGSYMLLPNIITPGLQIRNQTLSLCTHGTPNKLHYLQDMIKTWQGPISVSVFTHGPDLAIALYHMAFLHQCFEHVRKFVSFHLVYPLSPILTDMRKYVSMDINCQKMILNLEDQMNFELDVPYPHNVLRNTAVSYSVTPYVLVLDIDMVPSGDLRIQFANFVARRKPSSDKIVYVLPAFESQNDLQITTKESLKKHWEMKTVRPFYASVCAKCQTPTDYLQWLELPWIPFLDIGYTLDWIDPWEPFYVAKKEALPMYDGRFKQYGFNRISQVCELHVAGYKFAVLNNAFLVHKGFKELDRFHAQKETENNKNRELFRTFKKELRVKYPESSREC